MYIYTVCSHTFILFWLRKTFVFVETYRLSLRVFICAMSFFTSYKEQTLLYEYYAYRNRSYLGQLRALIQQGHLNNLSTEARIKNTLWSIKLPANHESNLNVMSTKQYLPLYNSWQLVWTWLYGNEIKASKASSMTLLVWLRQTTDTVWFYIFLTITYFKVHLHFIKQ